MFVNEHCKISDYYSQYLISGNRKNSVSDHKAIYVKIEIDSIVRGPNYWKMNMSFLENENYVKGMEILLKNEKENFKMAQSKKLFWEDLKHKIKQYSIKFSQNYNKNSISFIKQKELEIKNISESNISEQEKNDAIERIQDEMDDCYVRKAEGARVRSRVNWWEQGERSTSYFLRLDAQQQSSNVITQLEIDGDIVNKNSYILKEIYTFYEKPYVSDNICENSVTDYFNDIQTVGQLSDEENILCEGKISEKECENVVKKLKGNKSPGLDGIGEEFYKFFWPFIKQYYCSMIMEVYESGEMCSSMKKAVLSLIFKKGNKRDLNNYRPISITNSDYKILACVLANRMQTVLDKLISPEQSAYMKGRYIGSNCRYALDFIEYCNKFNINSIICFLDFSKAFDSLSHTFLLNCFQKYNFGPSFIRWIQILYNGPCFSVKNNGWLTKPIAMKRGIRQGCPVSAMAFLLATEFLCTRIKQNENICSIRLTNGEICSPISQYADDTALFLNGIDSLKNALSEIEKYNAVSGLKLNMLKTEALILGPLRLQMDLKKDICGINIATDTVKYLGFHLGSDLEKCYTFHWNEKLKKVESLLNMWKQRSLSLIGKILILKSLALPKLTMSFTLLPVKNDIIIKIKRLFFNFIWKSKDRIKRNTLIGSYQDGGLQMIDVELYEKSLKASYVRKIFGSKPTINPICQYYLNRICKINLILLHGTFDTKCLKILENIPIFYKEMLCSFSQCLQRNNIMTMNAIQFLNEQIWFNRTFVYRGQCLYFKNWIDSGFIYVKDLFESTGKFVSEKYVFECLKDKHNWLCEYVILKTTFKFYEEIFDCYTAPYIKNMTCNSFFINGERLHIDQLNTKIFYKAFVKKHFCTPISKKYWCKKFNFSYDYNFFKNLYLRKIQKEPIAKLAEFNYKLLHNLLVTNIDLNKWDNNISKDCELCNTLEDREHIILSCNIAKPFWQKFEQIFKCKITWKLLVLGFNYGNKNTNMIEECMSAMAWFIYNYKKKCKMKNIHCSQIGLLYSLRYDMKCYLQSLKNNSKSNKLKTLVNIL